uniref:BLOC-1 related complex subunit 8 n=1 Tax=Oryctolagus cuniculus TaxID=9986 RepID=A0A5F9CQ17_RABIT
MPRPWIRLPGPGPQCRPQQGRQYVARSVRRAQGPACAEVPLHSGQVFTAQTRGEGGGRRTWEKGPHNPWLPRWEEQSQGAIYTVEYACSAVKSLVDSSVYFRSVEGLLKQAISIRDHMNASAQGHR